MRHYMDMKTRAVTSSPAPLTPAEEESRQIEVNEVQTDVGVDAKHQHYKE